MIEIKNRWNGAVIFTSAESNTMLEAVKAAIAGGTNLSGTNLSGTNLSSIRNDFWDVLLRARHEVDGLRKALVEGRVDGSTYEGVCSCLVGTIANIKGIDYDEIENLKPNSNRHIERFFMGIKKGDTPGSNQVSRIVVEWVDEFQALLKEQVETK